MISRNDTSLNVNYEHGVFVAIFGLGVLIRGAPGIGKSTLALELIERQHQLIADDVVQFSVSDTEPSQICGRSTPMLFNLLAVRDIGILNIAKLYSADAVKPNHQLDFVIELDEKRDKPAPCDPFHPFTDTHILAHKIPSQKIFAFPGRNLALIVETVIKNYILYESGNDAGKELINRQQQYL